jgi:hypothetical protein
LAAFIALRREVVQVEGDVPGVQNRPNKANGKLKENREKGN